MARRPGNDATDVVESIRATGERLLGLMRQRGEVGVVLSDVGWVGDYEVKSFGNIGQPAALMERNIQLQPLGIGACHRQRPQTTVNPLNSQVRATEYLELNRPLDLVEYA